MKRIAATLFLFLAAGVTQPLPPYSSPEQSGQTADSEHDPRFDLVLLLREAEADGQYLFYSGDMLLTYRNLLTDARETNVMIYVKTGDVTVAHGIEKWFDGWGRVHTVSILKRQLAFNSFLLNKGIGARPLDTPENNADRATDEDIRQVRVTGIVDRATLKIPWVVLLFRYRKLSGKILSAEFDYRDITGVDPGQRRPPEFQKLRDLQDISSKTLGRLREGIMSIPLRKVNTQDDHSRYSGYFSGDLGHDTAEKTVRLLKQRPALRQYFETHELYGLENLDLPLDAMSKPPPSDPYSAEYRDYMDYSKKTAKLRDEFKPVPLGYGWPQPDEDYVLEYADPTSLNLDALREVDGLQKSADEALVNAEAYLKVVEEWITKKRAAGPTK